MRIRHILSLIVLLLSVQFSFGQNRVRLIIEQHDKAITKKKLNRIGRLKEFYPDSMTTLKAMNELLIILREQGFSAAGIDKQVWRNDTAIATVHTGNQYKFKSIDPGNVPKGVMRKVGFKEQQFVESTMSGKRLNCAEKADYSVL